MESLAGYAKDFAMILLTVGGLLAAIFVFWQLSPVAQIRITPRWIDQSSGKFVLRIEIENKSKVRIRQKVAKLQVLRYSLIDRGYLSEWVPFSKEAIIDGETPLEWNEPVSIFSSTEYLYPGEVITAERLEQIESPDQFLHIGVQYKSISKFHRLIQLALKWEESWTTTAIIARLDLKCA